MERRLSGVDLVYDNLGLLKSGGGVATLVHLRFSSNVARRMDLRRLRPQGCSKVDHKRQGLIFHIYQPQCIGSNFLRIGGYRRDLVPNKPDRTIENKAVLV